ncbi:hypothetical protein LCGC14_2619470, partial [marine sediment metagenome]
IGSLILKMYFIFIKKRIQILFFLIFNIVYSVENPDFLLGPNEKQYLIDLNDCNNQSSVCAIFNFTSISISHTCITDDDECSGIIISRNTSGCEKCKWLLCNSTTTIEICTNEKRLCDENIKYIDCNNISNTIIQPPCNCSEIGTLKEENDKSCKCKQGFTGKYCNECSKSEDNDRIYICCKIDLFGLEWGTLSPKLNELKKFMNGNYRNAQKCFFQNETTASLLSNGTRHFGCDCQQLLNSQQRQGDTINPVWLSNEISKKNTFKLPPIIINNNNSDEEEEDSIQGVIAFSFAISLLFLLCVCGICLCIWIVFISPSSKASQS